MRNAVPIVTVTRRWSCLNCPVEDVTHDPRPHTRFHTCLGLRGGLTAPLLEGGIKAKVEAHDREDYVGREIAPVDGNGRPVMSVTTTRDDGEDCVVFAPTAIIQV